MGDIPSTLNVKSNLKDLLFGDFDQIPSKSDPSKMTLQPKSHQTIVPRKPSIINDSDLFNAPEMSDEEESDDKASELTQRKDLLPTENSSNSIYNILARTSKATARKFRQMKARMGDMLLSDDEIEIQDSAKDT